MASDQADKSLVIADPTKDSLGNSALGDPNTGLATGSSVVLAVQSADCYPIFVSRSEHKTLPRPQMLAYELEESLPFDGDDLALDAVESKQGWLTITTHAPELLSEIERLENSGVYIRSITPTLLLAWASLAREQNLKPYNVVLWQSHEGIDAVTLEAGTPVAWRWIAGTKVSIDGLLDEWVSEERECNLLAVDCDEEFCNELERHLSVTALDLPRGTAADDEAARITAGRATPIIDLRNGLLESNDRIRPFKRSLIMFIACLFLAQLGILGGLFARDWQYRQQTSTLVGHQEEVFGRVFPNQSVPIGIKSRLESEHRRLSGTRGMVSDNLPALKSVVPITHVLLSTLPEQASARYRLDWIELSPDEIEITGSARSYADLETISNGMQVGGLEVPPVSSNKTTEGVSLRFDGIRFREKKDSK